MDRADDDFPSSGHGYQEVVSCPYREGGGRGRGGGGCQLGIQGVIHEDGIISTTYKCQDTATLKEYLLKRVYLKNLTDTDIKYREHEVRIWTRLRHHNILTCLLGWQRKNELWVLSEVAEQTVQNLVMSKAKAPPQALFVKWLYQLASALQYLHEFEGKPVLHRNLKPSNIMVVPHYVLKLCDFGISKQLQDKEDMTRSCVGSAIIMSPEIINNVPYNTKTDIWSLGITAVYIATQQDAICARTFDTLFRKTQMGQVHGIAGQYSSETEQLVNSLLQVEPDHRPSASQLLTDLRLCFSNCTTPPNADSYPARQMIPQKSSTTSSSRQSRVVSQPRSRSDSGSRPGSDKSFGSGSTAAENMSDRKIHGKEAKISTRSEKVGDVLKSSQSTKTSTRLNRTESEVCAAACQTTQSLLVRDRLDNVPSRQFTTTTTNTVPSVESLSLTILHIILSDRGAQAAQRIESNRRPLSALPRRRQTPMPPIAAVQTDTGTCAGEADSDSYSEKATSRGKMPDSSGESVSSLSASSRRHSESGKQDRTASLLNPSSSVSTRGHSDVGKRASTERTTSWVEAANNQRYRKETNHASSGRSASLVAPPGQGKAASMPQRAEGRKHSSRENDEFRKNSVDKDANMPVPSRRRSEDSKLISQGRPSSLKSSPHGTKTPSRRRSQEGNEPSPNARLSSMTDFPADVDSQRALSDSRSETSTPASHTRTESFDDMEVEDLEWESSDTLMSNPQLISTYPGAFNVDRAPIPDQSPLHHSSTEPGLAAFQSRALSRHLSERDTSKLDEERETGRGARAASALPHASLLLNVPVERWPAKTREYWILAKELVAKLGDDFFTAVKYARLFSTKEVQLWLRERGVESASQCMDDIKKLLVLDDQLDDDTLLAFNHSLRHLPHHTEDDHP